MKKENEVPKKDRLITMNRKEAIQKVGKYAAFTAASMILLMSPADSAPAMNSPIAPRRR
ncbi:MAG TPA: hypothetical protein VGK10_12060 [Prolixibacteraceae bacterium]|jgi:hypothetical protein